MKIKKLNVLVYIVLFKFGVNFFKFIANHCDFYIRCNFEQIRDH